MSINKSKPNLLYKIKTWLGLNQVQFTKEKGLNRNIKIETNICSAIQEAMQEHKSDLEKLPTDTSINIDHYLYGSPKK